MITLDLKEVNKIDLSHLLEKTTSDITKKYLVYPQGEHYKFLAYISGLLNNSIIFDVGTHHGSSALALAENKSNTIISYDIYSQCKLKLPIDNIEINIGNAIEDERLGSAELILLDTVHDGIFEAKFIEHLVNINYQGILILDDIHLCPEMREVWNAIELKKYDLTYVAHTSGTGLIDFNNNVNVIYEADRNNEVVTLERFELSPVETVRDELQKTDIPKDIQRYILKSLLLKEEVEQKLGQKLF